MKKTLLILNPNAGSCTPEVRSLLNGDERVEVRATDSAESARQAAAEAGGSGFDQVVAAGGDGTVNQVLNGLMAGSAPTPRLAVLPLGTGNDLARTLALPTDVNTVLDLLHSGPERTWDLLVAETPDGQRHYAINAASGGFSRKIGEALSGQPKGWGLLSYLKGAVDALPVPRYHLELALDSGSLEVDDVVALIAANGRTIGGGLRLAPDANPEDGLLELVVLMGESLPALAGMSALLASGQVPSDEHVIVRRTAKVCLKSDPPLEFNLDGELFPTLRTIEVLPRAIRVLVGPDYQRCPNARAW